MDNNTHHIFTRATALTLTLSSFRICKSTSTQPIEVDADKERLRLSKYIIESEEWDDINTHDAKIRAYLNKMCLPSFYKSGIYLVPYKDYVEVDAALDKFESQRNMLIDNFLLVYYAKKDQARLALRTLFNERDYPTLQAVKASYVMIRSYGSISTPDEQLKQISHEVFLKEKQRLSNLWDDSLESIKQMLRVNTLEIVNHFLEVLTPINGKIKGFHDSTLDSLDHLFKYFDHRNIANDTQLAELIKEAQSYINLAGKSLTDRNRILAEKGKKQLNLTKLLKNDELVREHVTEGFKDIKIKIQELTVTSNTRAIMLEDEEDATVAA